MTKLEEKTGTPERPLSDLGLRGYRAYWEAVILDVLRSYDDTLRGTPPKKKKKDNVPLIDGPLTLQAISSVTGIKHEDVVATLAGMGLLKYWNGPGGVNHDVLITRESVLEFMKHKPLTKLKRMIDPAGVTWTDPNKVEYDEDA